MKRELTFKNEEQELTRVTEFMESVCDELQLDMHVAMKVQVAMEEMVTNVIFYAYPEGTSADITLTAENDDKELTFVLSDTGIPFDPTAKEDADIEENPMDREQGGMGILIVKNIMNEVSYQRLGETKGGKTIIKTGARIDTLNAAQFEQEIQPALEQGVNLEIDCTELNYMASSGLRIFQATMRNVVRSLGGQMKLTHVNDDIFDILKMTGFNRHITIERV